MKIRTTFVISVILFAIIMVVIMASLVITNRRVDSIDDQIATSINIERRTGELDYLTDDYLLYREEDKRRRWEAKWADLAGDMENISPVTLEEQVIVENIRMAHQRRKDVFDDMVSSFAVLEGTLTAENIQSLIQVSWNRMAVQSQGITFDGTRLSQMLRDDRDGLRQTNNLLIISLLGAFSAYFALSYVIVQRRLLRSVADLHTGTKVIGSGDLDFEVAVKRDDEIGELAGAFNRMTADLKGITASKEALEKEIADREAAQAAFRESESRYKSLFENMVEGFAYHRIILDGSGEPVDYIFLEVNDAFEELTGLKREAIIGKRATEVLPGIENDAADWISKYGEIALEGAPRRFEQYSQALQKWYSIAAYSPAREYFVTAFDDITERKLAEQELRDKQATIQDYAGRLSILHKIGLTLNRETDKEKLLETTLSGAAELTRSGVGSIMLVKEGRIEMASSFSADWYAKQWPGSNILTRVSRLDRSLEQIFSQSGKDAIRINDQDELGKALEFTEVHPELSGLLVNTIRDSRGRLRGYLVLGSKADSGEFTDEDGEIIDLLSGQISVALTSAENFEREHQVASTLQDSLLPSAPVRRDLDIGILYQSASETAKLGGDFYDFIELNDGRLAIVIGDVCGKGLEAATATAMIKYMLRAYLEDGLTIDECLSKLNRAVHRQLPMEKFVTLLLAAIDTDSGTLEYVSAGHPRPILINDGKVSLLEIHNSLPLGVIRDFVYESSTAQIDAGGSLLMYTDGLLEARTADGGPFGEERIMSSMKEFHGITAHDDLVNLVNNARIHSQGHLKDDIALLIIRRGA